MEKKGSKTTDKTIVLLVKKWEKVWSNLNEVNIFFQSYIDTVLMVQQRIKMEPLITSFETMKKSCEKFYEDLDDAMASCKTTSHVLVTFPWQSDKFVEEWKFWKDYLLEQHQITLSTRAEQKQLDFLAKITENDETKAYPVLDYAMANLYKMFFKLDEKQPKVNKKSKPVRKDEDF